MKSNLKDFPKLGNETMLHAAKKVLTINIVESDGEEK